MGSYYDVPKAIFYPLKRDHNPLIREGERNGVIAGDWREAVTTFLLVASAVWPCCACGQCLFRSLAFRPVRLQPDLEAFQEGAYKGAWGRGDLAFNFACQSRTGLHERLRNAIPIRLSGVGAVQPVEEDTHARFT